MGEGGGGEGEGSVGGRGGTGGLLIPDWTDVDTTTLCFGSDTPVLALMVA